MVHGSCGFAAVCTQPSKCLSNLAPLFCRYSAPHNHPTVAPLIPGSLALSNLFRVALLISPYSGDPLFGVARICFATFTSRADVSSSTSTRRMLGKLLKPFPLKTTDTRLSLNAISNNDRRNHLTQSGLCASCGFGNRRTFFQGPLTSPSQLQLGGSVPDRPSAPIGKFSQEGFPGGSRVNCRKSGLLIGSPAFRQLTRYCNQSHPPATNCVS